MPSRARSVRDALAVPTRQRTSERRAPLASAVERTDSGTVASIATLVAHELAVARREPGVA
jgi:hypothetical protein